MRINVYEVVYMVLYMFSDIQCVVMGVVYACGEEEVNYVELAELLLLK